MYEAEESNLLEKIEERKSCYNCPISYQIMKNPVVTKYGHHFDKDHLLEWIEIHGTCPITR